MSLTEEKTIDAQIQLFFFDKLLPLARRIHSENRIYFPTGFDPIARSYYMSRKKTSMDKADFELTSCYSTDGLRQYLHEMWTDQGDSELAALACEMSHLADLLYQIEDETEEVSPFIYVMF